MYAGKKIESIVAAGLRDLAKERGFRKKAFTFRRRLGATQQILNVQLSQGNSGNHGCFYLNVGIGFDALFRLEGQSSLECWKHYQCHYYRRAEDLVSGAADEWNVDATTDAEVVGNELRVVCEKLIDRLDGVDTPAAMLHSMRLEHGSELMLRSSLRYVLDDLPGALEDLKKAADFFSDRPNMSVDALITGRRLERLRPLLRAQH